LQVEALMLSTSSGWTQFVAAQQGIGLDEVAASSDVVAMKQLLHGALDGITLPAVLAAGKAFVVPSNSEFQEQAVQHLVLLDAIKACLAVLQGAGQQPSTATAAAAAGSWAATLQEYCEVRKLVLPTVSRPVAIFGRGTCTCTKLACNKALQYDYVLSLMQPTATAALGTVTRCFCLTPLVQAVLTTVPCGGGSSGTHGVW
jgi:hypothetical protein